MSWLLDRLRNSRTAKALATHDKGEAIDWQGWSIAQPLDAVRAGEEFAAAIIEEEQRADDEFERTLGQL